jgi:hypothetical protein
MVDLLILLFILKIYFLSYKTSCINEEVNCIEPSPPARVPWFCEQHAYEIDSFLVSVVVKNVLKRDKGKKMF